MIRRLDSPSVFLTVAAAVAVAGCNDKGATLSVSNGTLAVGAYQRFTYGDACTGGGGSGKVPMPDFCSSESVEEVLELSSSDPSVLEIIADSDDPRGPVGPMSSTMLGRKPGQSTVTFKGRFSDGTERKTSATIHVKAPDNIKLVAGCGGPPATNLLTLVETQASFDLEIDSGAEKLVGWLPNAVTADGVVLGDGSSDDNRGTWQAPSVPVVLKLQSSVVSKVTGTLTAFGPDQVTGMTLQTSVTDDDLQRPAYTGPGSYFYVGTGVLVQGQTPCTNLPAEIHSSTPAVCSGPAGEAAWAEDDPGDGKAFPRSEGVCTLAVSKPGGPILATRSFPVFFVSEPPPGLHTPGFGTDCDVEGGTACTGGYTQPGLCKSGHWVEMPWCPADQVCDFVPDTTSGCVPGVVCAKCRGLR